MGVREAFQHEWQTASAAYVAGDLDSAFRHLERAHILGQRHTWLHMKSHIGMWHVGWKRRDLREIFGQLSRLFAALLFSRIWVPIGNTGGANVSAFKPMPLPADLQALFDAESKAP
jgi:hypothetical protein